MRIAVYTLTRDRLEYTQRSFAALHQNAGIEFNHVVIDNGSRDGTAEWLKSYARGSAGIDIIPLPENVGISGGSNMALDFIRQNYPGVDVIAKYDNDAALTSPDELLTMARLVHEAPGDLGPAWLLSPRVVGINRQPSRGREVQLGGHPIGLTAIVGGLFHVCRGSVYQQYRFNPNLPKAWGQDDTFCKWFKSKGGVVGYVEDLVVEHIDSTDGQAKRFPEYFERKYQEEGERVMPL
jgi:glycosyltransferase involved in cell wall biosynthesis